MNEYGRLAMEHWSRYLPDRYAQIEDPKMFFTDLGHQAESRMRDLEIELEARTALSSDYMTKVGQLNAIRAQAREIVLADLVLLEPESEPEDEPVDDLDPPTIGPDGMPTDPGHPLWADLENDLISSEEFREKSAAWLAQEYATWANQNQGRDRLVR